MENVPLPPRQRNVKPKKYKSKKASSFNLSAPRTEGSAAAAAAGGGTQQQELPERGERVSLSRGLSGSSRGKSFFIELSRTQRIKLKVLDDFLQRIRALRTLEKDPLVASPIQIYFNALHEYQDLQVESLAAVLTPTSEEQDNGEHLAKEKQLLRDILADADGTGPFDADMWTRWYSVLVSVHSCKSRHFPEQERSAVVRALATMETTFVPEGSVLESLVYCSTIYFIFDHFRPFPTTALGNSLSQHGLTWSLRRCGFPLLVQFFETSHEKFDYIFAKEQVRGSLEKRDWSRLMDFPRIVSPMVGLLIDRLVASVDKLSVLVSEKERMDDDAAQARAARLQHERQVTEGMCLICLDEKPNVATLCCGQPAHLNCIAQWLDNHDSCPQCRGDFPPLTVRKAQPAPILRRRRATGSDGDSSWDVRTRHPAAEFVDRGEYNFPREISLSDDDSSYNRMISEIVAEEESFNRTRSAIAGIETTEQHPNRFILNSGRLVSYAGHLVHEDVLDGHPRDTRLRDNRDYDSEGVSIHTQSSESTTDSFNSVEVPQRPPPFRVVDRTAPRGASSDDEEEDSSSESEETTSVYTENNSVTTDDEDISIPSQPSQHPFHAGADQWADFTDEEHRYLFWTYVSDGEDGSSVSQQIDD